MTGKIVSLRDRLPVRPALTPHEEFGHARSTMLQAWRRWLATAPPGADSETELTGTLGAMRAIRDLEAPHDP